MASKSAIFTVVTPFERVSTATLYDNTWNEHILPGHPEVEGQLLEIQNTLVRPTFVCTGTKDNYYQFVSHREIDSDGSPMVVVVNADPSKPVVTTAFRGRKKYLDPEKFTVKWP